MSSIKNRGGYLNLVSSCTETYENKRRTGEYQVVHQIYEVLAMAR